MDADTRSTLFCKAGGQAALSLRFGRALFGTPEDFAQVLKKFSS